MPMPETHHEDHMAAKNDEQESGWDVRDQWNKLWGTTGKVELVRSCTQERGGERLFYSLGVDSRRTKSERETKDHLEKNCWEGEKQGRVEELECSQGSGAEQRVLVWECVGLMRLLAWGVLMMMTWIHYKKAYRTHLTRVMFFCDLITFWCNWQLLSTLILETIQRI